MKLLHTADLHIGKIVNEFSMLEDQKYILQQIVDIAKKTKVDVVLLAGDIYDRAIPSVEAVELLDWFFNTLLAEKIQIMVISGNHDSPERLSFAGKILEKQGLYISGAYNGSLKKVTLTDKYGEVVFHFFPFFKTAVAGQYLEQRVNTVQDMAEQILKREESELDKKKRNVMLGHYFVLHGEQKAEEQEEGVGGLDAIESTLFDDYDYVALGHIHGESYMGRKEVNYSGSPLKYSFSEANQNKSVKIIELKEKGEIIIEKHPLKPLHDMRIIKGELRELMKKEVVDLAPFDDYICAVLTDKDDLVQPMDMLRSVYPNAMQIIMERYQKEVFAEAEQVVARREKNLLENYQDFYELVEGEPLQGDYFQLIQEMVENIT
ncbi:MAG: exonuclease SbcCD subunit D [Lachnospiraceae bacterium]|nr:exonuclease SbcCD subunit D [Lachnospiraceae bacterium]